MRTVVAESHSKLFNEQVAHSARNRFRSRPLQLAGVRCATLGPGRQQVAVVSVKPTDRASYNYVRLPVCALAASGEGIYEEFVLFAFRFRLSPNTKSVLCASELRESGGISRRSQGERQRAPGQTNTHPDRNTYSLKTWPLIRSRAAVTNEQNSPETHGTQQRTGSSTTACDIGAAQSADNTTATTLVSAAGHEQFLRTCS